jgi:hypothetical protein
VVVIRYVITGAVSRACVARLLFSHQTTSYSQIVLTHRVFVPAADIFADFPSGCPRPCCTEMIHFSRSGLDGGVVHEREERGH